MPTSPHTWTRLVVTLAVVLAAAGAGVLAGASPATAHAALRSSSPSAGEVLERAPREVVLRLSEAPLAVGSVVEVTSTSGGVVSTGKAQVVGDQVRQALDATRAGSYRVDWRVTSSDGHPISDTFTFTVTSGSQPPSTATVAPPTHAPAAPAPATASGHHGSAVHAGDEFAFAHVAGTVVILLLGALGCAISLRRSTRSEQTVTSGETVTSEETVTDRR